MSTPSASGPSNRDDAIITNSTNSTDRNWLLLTLAVTLLIMVLLDRPLIRGDGVAYLAWVDSFVLDADIQFDNQLDRLRPVNTYQLQWNDATGRLVNIFPFGSAIIQAPFYALGHLFALNGWWDVNPDYFHQMQGVWRPYSLWLMIGANAMGLATVGLSWHIARRFCPAPSATLVTLAVLLGTPLLYYLTVSPLNSHSAGALAFSLFLYLAVRHSNPTLPQMSASMPVSTPAPALPKNNLAETRIWVAIGISAGMMVLSRWQLLLVATPAWPILFWHRRWRKPLVAMAAAALLCLPLPISWSVMFGEPFVIPYDAISGSSGGFLTMPRNALAVLGQTIAHSPLVFLALLGVAALWQSQRRLAIYAVVAIGLQLYVNGGVLDWWAGETYGMRRMSELFPLYAMLLAALFDWAAHKPKLAFMLSGVLLLLCAYSILYLLIFANYTWTNTDGVFINHLTIMWRHFWSQPHRWQVSWEVWRTHLGPWAWAMPGP